MTPPFNNPSNQETAQFQINPNQTATSRNMVFPVGTRLWIKGGTYKHHVAEYRRQCGTYYSLVELVENNRLVKVRFNNIQLILISSREAAIRGRQVAARIAYQENVDVDEIAAMGAWAQVPVLDPSLPLNPSRREHVIQRILGEEIDEHQLKEEKRAHEELKNDFREVLMMCVNEKEGSDP
ncbi:unknown protein [Seminavis robusta]|uniref:Uncharacterized protein n=1 Tax=Seminavis robusta TaxID=568900 RepID=A0A9N8HC06_9STRA|nr:unknown protein [Seminavis robusta]|eukprot:Sro280_g106990.1 n/a (181) ;mRNA; r:14290-14832